MRLEALIFGLVHVVVAASVSVLLFYIIRPKSGTTSPMNTARFFCACTVGFMSFAVFPSISFPDVELFARWFTATLTTGILAFVVGFIFRSVFKKQ